MNMHLECSSPQGGIWHEQMSLVMLGTHMVYPSCCYMTTYRHVTLTITRVIEISLSFGSMSMLRHVFIFGYLAPGPRRKDHVDLIYKHK